jgi:DNA-binding response OmpR family regulator
VDAHVVKLRQKLEPDSNAPRHFLTVHGVGYRFVP